MPKFSSEAYDFSLFEERTAPPSSGQEFQEEREPQQSPRENVVELPEKELEKSARPKRRPLRMAAATLCFGAILATVTTVIYNQVQLTELTEEINTTTQALQEAESVEIQLNMEASQQMNGSQVEEYAANELGMSKVTSGQVTYVAGDPEDQGTVVRETDGGSLWDWIWSMIRSWFA